MSLPNESPSSAIPYGTILDGRFEIQELLGAGSFGEVYQAKQLVFGRPLREVALKLFKRDAVKADNVTEIFSDAVTLLGLQEENPDPVISRHLIQVFDMGITSDKRAFMSMRLVRGKKTLLNALDRNVTFGMPVNLSLKYLRQILIPLAWMHTLTPAVVHGDLKPDNVLLAEDSRLVLTDFGLAARLPLGTRGGAISYQAAETLARVRGRAEADIFAVGVIWYELLTRRHPFAGVGLEADAEDNQEESIRAHLAARRWPIRAARSLDDDQRIVPATELNADLKNHPQLEAALHRCLAPEASQRYANAQLLLNDIDEYIAGGSIAVPRSPEGETTTTADIVLATRDEDAILDDAEMFLSRKQPQRALESLAPLLSSDAPSVPAMARKGRALAQLGKTKEAEAIWDDVNAAAPRSRDEQLLLADIYDAIGNTRQAANLRKRFQ